ncbi:hypothetical protein Hanom_Chr02g00174051 [Helianthus anomalus]
MFPLFNVVQGKEKGVFFFQKGGDKKLVNSLFYKEDRLNNLKFFGLDFFLFRCSTVLICLHNYS